MRDDALLQDCPLCDAPVYASVEAGIYVVRCPSCWYQTFDKATTIEQAAQAHAWRRSYLAVPDHDHHRGFAARRKQERDDACDRNDGRWDTSEPLPKLQPQESRCE